MSQQSPVHGTRHGFSRHHKNKEKPCYECNMANNIAQRKRGIGNSRSAQYIVWNTQRNNRLRQQIILLVKERNPDMYFSNQYEYAKAFHHLYPAEWKQMRAEVRNEWARISKEIT